MPENCYNFRNSADPVLMKCRIIQHFIWVFTVCQSTGLCISSNYRVTVNSEIFAGILFSRIALKDIFHNYYRIYLQSDFVISWGLYFHELLLMQSFAEIKPSWKFPNLQLSMCGYFRVFFLCPPPPPPPCNSRKVSSWRTLICNILRPILTTRKENAL